MPVVQKMYCKHPNCGFFIILNAQTDLQRAAIDQEAHLSENNDHRIGVEIIWEEPTTEPPQE